MKLTKEDLELVKIAKETVNFRQHNEHFSSGSVGCALITTKNNLFRGVCLDLPCGVGFCAESSAISNMITNKETKIKTIVACSDKRVLPPCGRCREVMQLIDKNNLNNTEVIISNKEKVKLTELIKYNWLK